MYKTQLNQRLKEITNAIATLDAKTDRNEKLNADEIKAYGELVTEGKQIRDQLNVALEADAIKAWAKESDGQSAVKAAFKHESVQTFTTDADKEQEKRAQEQAAKGAYKSAFESLLRFGFANLGPNDRKLLEGGRVYDEGSVKAIGDGSATGGDYTVPEDFQAEVLKKEPGLIGLTDLVRKQPTSRDILVWPTINYTTNNTHTAPHRLVFTGKIPSSATIHNVTDQTFGEKRIPVNTAMASQLVGNTLIEDSATDIIGLTTELFQENILQDVENYICNGTGSGQPEGLFVNSTAQTNSVASGSAATLTSNGLVNLYWNTPAQYRRGAAFVMSSSTALVIAKLTDANGRYIWQGADMFGGGLNSPQQDGVVVTNPRLMLMPVAITEHAPAVTTNSYSISFGNHKGYIYADRVGMSIKVLRELYAETDRTLFLLRMRFGGALAEDYKVKLQKTSA